MLVESSVPNPAAFEGRGSSGASLDGSSNSGVLPSTYPYSIPPEIYPNAANRTAGPTIEAEASVPLPGAVSGFAVVNASASGTGSKLWYSTAIYSDVDAKVIVANGTCGAGCGQFPLSWSIPQRIATLTSTVSALRIVTVGPILVAAATAGTTTHIYNDTSGTWAAFGSTISGTLMSLASNSEEIAVATASGDSAKVTVFSPGGVTLQTKTFDPSGATGIASAGVTYVPDGYVYRASVVIGTDGTDKLLYSSSVGGGSFSSLTTIGNYTPIPAASVLNSIGATRLTPNGGLPGQLSLLSVQDQLLLLYTTDVLGTVVPATLSSGTGGASWNGPFFGGPTNGSVLDPVLANSPVGLVYATWIAADYGAGAVEQAIYSGDGTQLMAPEVVPGSGQLGAGMSPSAWPSIAVDGLQRPFLTWVTSTGAANSSSIAFSGAFLNTTAALDWVETGVTDPMIYPDMDGETPTELTASVTQAQETTERDLANGHLCNAQTYSIEYLYSNITHMPLFTGSGSGTGCSPTGGDAILTAAGLNPNIGVNAPNTYLAIYADQALEAMAVPLTASPVAEIAGLTTSSTLTAPPLLSTYNSSDIDSEPETITVQPVPYSPTAFQLAVTATLPTWSEPDDIHDGCTEDLSLYTQPYEGWENVSVDGGTTYDFPMVNGSFPSPWIYDLTPFQNYSWSASFAVLNREKVTVTSDNCEGGPPAGNITYDTPAAWPISRDPTISPHDWFVTSLGVTHGSAFVNALYVDDDQKANITTEFNTSLEAYGNATLYGPSHTWSVAPPVEPALSFDLQPGDQVWTGDSYTLGINVSSRPGSSVSPGSPDLQIGSSGYAPPETADIGCSFYLESASEVPQLVGTPVTTWYNGTVFVAAWQSNQSVDGFFDYSMLGTGLSWVISGITPIASGARYNYTVVVRGLEPWASYSGYVGLEWQNGCLNSQVVSAAFGFSTPDYVQLSETDQPYDSISDTGGGAQLSFTVPYPASRYIGNTALENGTVLLWNESGPTAAVQIPVSSSSQLYRPWGSSTYELNITPSQLNITYTAELFLNFTNGSGQWNVIGLPITFSYERDTSGDSLTDMEKELGWTIPVTYAGGSSVDLWETANPAVYATNGLVSDYVEKEFDLNPRSLDTAMSHMLDTWNLTFELSSSACPAEFECWYENSTNPFSFAVTPGGGRLDGAPNATNSTNEPHWTHGGLQDDSPYDSSVLWTGGALGVLQTLIVSEGVGWLRGIVMDGYDGEWTLTVWGKLSWGADPQEGSTLRDGIPDGEQANPLLRTVLQVEITSWWADLHSSNDEAAPFLEVSSGSSGSGSVYYEGYAASKKGSNVSWSGTYYASVPLVVTSQFVYLNLSIDDNGSASGRTWYYPLSCSSSEIDLLGQTGPLTADRSQSNASITATYTVLRVGEKANTLLWAPANNTTLSSTPWGLKRYAAEPDFDLIVLNLTNAATVSNIAGAEGGWTYSVHLNAGLNNLLVPRGEFLSSPLGQALINNTNESVSRSGSGVTFHPLDWSGRTETSSSNPVPTSGNSWNPSYIWVFSTTAQSENGSGSGIYGGLASNPGLESGDESLQVQSVIWVNVSSTGYGNLTSEVGELKDLFGGLVLNSSGNLSGNILTVTSELGTLGLPWNLLGPLANATLSNGGAYSAPKYQTTPPSAPWWGSVGLTIYDTVSGIAGAVSVVWSDVAAAAAYVGEAARWLSDQLGLTRLETQFVTGLVSLAAAMAFALNVLLTRVVIPAIDALLNPAFAPITGAMSLYGLDLGVNLLLVGDDHADGLPIAPAAAEFWTNFSGPVFDFAFGVALALAIVLTILTGLSLGATFLIPIVVGIVIFSAGQAMADRGGPSYLSRVDGINPISEGVPPLIQEITGWTVTTSGAPGWFIGALSDLLALTTTSWAVTDILTAWELGKQADWTDSIGADLGILSIVVAGVAAYYSSVGSAVVSTFFDIGSLAVDWEALGKDDGDNLENYVVLCLDAAAGALDGCAVYEAGWG